MNKVLRNTVMGAAAGLMLLATPAVAHAQEAGRAETAAAHPDQITGDLEIDLLGTDLLDVVL
jgi:hypothetical protein